MHAGFIFSFGVFQKYLSTQGPFTGNSKAISSVGTVTSGTAYLSAPFVQRYITGPFPGQRQNHMIFALLCCIIGCVAASFTKTVRLHLCAPHLLKHFIKIWQLILTQGVIFGLGVGIMTLTSASILNEWFATRRGLAFGVVFGGGGVFGIGLPPFFQKLFATLGYANTLRIWAGILVGEKL